MVEPLAARDLFEARHTVEDKCAQAILISQRCDEGSPGINLQALQTCFNIPVLCCSSPVKSDTLGRLGVAEYLVKPIGREELLSGLKRGSRMPTPS